MRLVMCCRVLPVTVIVSVSEVKYTSTAVSVPMLQIMTLAMGKLQILAMVTV